MLDVKLATGSDILRPASDGRVGGVGNRWSTARSRLRFRLDSRGGKTQFRKGIGTSETSKAGAESTGIVIEVLNVRFESSISNGEEMMRK